ncbi:aspartate-tRNA ligase [Annulohypoxylon moriforme]|nr:aspartate-tRNA ligase [Annulohypoxylon moriforme]
MGSINHSDIDPTSNCMTGVTSSKCRFDLFRNIPPGGEKTVQFDARIHATSERESDAESIILLMRDGDDLLTVYVNSKEVQKNSWETARTSTIESILRISGTLAPAGKHPEAEQAIRSSSNVLPNVVTASSLTMISLAVDGLVNRSLGQLKLNERLNNKVLDMRSAARGAVFGLMSGIWELSVEFCLSQGLMWLSTPNIIGYKAPGDNDYFPVTYFDHAQASLAQTSEYHHQMALSMDFLPGIFEIRTMCRREHQISKRRLAEFTSLEIIFAIQNHWTEVLDKADAFTIFVIGQLQKRPRFQHLTSLARKMYSSAGNFKLGVNEKGQVPRLTFKEAKMILKEQSGSSTYDMHGDLTSEDEAILGRLMRSNPPAPHPQSDVFVVTEYPTSIRGLQVCPSSTDPDLTNSGDLILCGQETASLWQYQHSSEAIRAAMRAKNPPADPDSDMFKPWISAFDAGIYPHGTFGYGLNRLLQGYLGMDDVHETVLFPRDANTLIP